MGGRGSSSATAGAGGGVKPLPASATVSDFAERYAELTGTGGTWDLEDRFPDFVLDKLTQSERSAIRSGSGPGDWRIKRETEKAALIQVQTDYGNIEFWSPKSVIRTDEQMAERARNERKSAFERAAYYTYLKKEAGVSLTDNSRWPALQKSIENMRRSYLTFDEFKAGNGGKTLDPMTKQVLWQLKMWGYPTKW